MNQDLTGKTFENPTYIIDESEEVKVAKDWGEAEEKANVGEKEKADLSSPRYA